MTNRQQRRATKLPELPVIPNISGTEESCDNCRFARYEAWRKTLHMMRQPAPPDDETICLLEPGGGKGMKTYGWCSHHAPKLNG